MLDPCGQVVRVEIALGAAFVLTSAVFMWRSFLIYRAAIRRSMIAVDLHADALDARLRAVAALTRAEELAASSARESPPSP